MRTARAFCTAQLRVELAGGLSPYAMEDLAGDAAMVVSELVTNAIRAGASTIRLDVGRVGGLFRITVIDDADGMPILSEPDPSAVAGRGLRIVDALSARWGVEPSNGRKRVWADLDLSNPATDGLHGGLSGGVCDASTTGWPQAEQ